MQGERSNAGKEISIGGRIFDVTVPGGECVSNMVLYRDTATGVTSLRFVDDVALKDGTIADGQEEKLASAYLDNWDERTDAATVSVIFDDEMTQLLANMKEEYGISQYAFENGISKYFCDPGNRDQIRISLAAVLNECFGEGNTDFSGEK